MRAPRVLALVLLAGTPAAPSPLTVDSGALIETSGAPHADHARQGTKAAAPVDAERRHPKYLWQLLVLTGPAAGARGSPATPTFAELIQPGSADRPPGPFKAQWDVKQSFTARDADAVLSYLKGLGIPNKRANQDATILSTASQLVSKFESKSGQGMSHPHPEPVELGDTEKLNLYLRQLVSIPGDVRLYVHGHGSRIGSEWIDRIGYARGYYDGATVAAALSAALKTQVADNNLKISVIGCGSAVHFCPAFAKKLYDDIYSPGRIWSYFIGPDDSKGTMLLKCRTDATEFSSRRAPPPTRLDEGLGRGQVYRTKLPKTADVATFFKCWRINDQAKEEDCGITRNDRGLSAEDPSMGPSIEELMARSDALSLAAAKFK